jgi:hypothetical protein
VNYDSQALQIVPNPQRDDLHNLDSYLIYSQKILNGCNYERRNDTLSMTNILKPLTNSAFDYTFNEKDKNKRTKPSELFESQKNAKRPSRISRASKTRPDSIRYRHSFGTRNEINLNQCILDSQRSRKSSISSYKR